MSRKDYVATATIVSTISDKVERARIAYEFVDMFTNDNPNFRPKQFLFACGVDSELPA